MGLGATDLQQKNYLAYTDTYFRNVDCVINATLLKILYSFHYILKGLPFKYSQPLLITKVATRGLLGVNLQRAHLGPEHGAFLKRSQSRYLKQEHSEAGWPLSKGGLDGLEPCTEKYWPALARSAILECL